MVPGLVMQDRPAGLAFDEVEKSAVYKAIRTRRDVRRGFLAEPLTDRLLRTLLEAAHAAPSVGLMQPTRFIVVRDLQIRQQVHGAFERANAHAMSLYEGERQQLYRSLKLEGILDAPQNLCLCCDQNHSQGHGLGRQTVPETAIYSTVCAVQNLWLAARAEGVGVGWVSILDAESLKAILRVPPQFVPVAYLCLGYVECFAEEPELERFGWEQRRPLDEVLCFDQWSPVAGESV